MNGKRHKITYFEVSFKVRSHPYTFLFKFVTGKPRDKRPLGRPKRRWEGNIRMNLEEIGINARNWLDSARDRDYWRVLVNAALNFRVL